MKTAKPADIWNVMTRNQGQIVTVYHAQTPGCHEGLCRRKHLTLRLIHDTSNDTWAIYRRDSVIAFGVGRTWPTPDAV